MYLLALKTVNGSSKQSSLQQRVLNSSGIRHDSLAGDLLVAGAFMVHLILVMDHAGLARVEFLCVHFER